MNGDLHTLSVGPRRRLLTAKPVQWAQWAQWFNYHAGDLTVFPVKVSVSNHTQIRATAAETLCPLCPLYAQHQPRQRITPPLDNRPHPEAGTSHRHPAVNGRGSGGRRMAGRRVQCLRPRCLSRSGVPFSMAPKNRGGVLASALTRRLERPGVNPDHVSCAVYFNGDRHSRAQPMAPLWSGYDARVRHLERRTCHLLRSMASGLCVQWLGARVTACQHTTPPRHLGILPGGCGMAFEGILSGASWLMLPGTRPERLAKSAPQPAMSSARASAAYRVMRSILRQWTGNGHGPTVAPPRVPPLFRNQPNSTAARTPPPRPMRCIVHHHHRGIHQKRPRRVTGRNLQARRHTTRARPPPPACHHDPHPSHVSEMSHQTRGALAFWHLCGW